MGALEAGELQSVLEQAEELVGVDQLGAVLAADVAAVGKHLERVDGVLHPNAWVDAPVHELEQLDGEFDVAKPAAAQLEFALAQVFRHVLEHAPAHRLDVLDEACALRRLPDQRAQRRDVALPQLGAACHRARLEQRLELPGLRPPFVVGQVAVDGAHERAGLALGAEVGVDLEEARGAKLHHGAGGLGCRGCGWFGDEDDVDVRDVVQLAGAALAHRHDREAGVGVVVAVGFADGDGQRCGQSGVGERCDVLGDVAVAHLTCEVGGGDAHHEGEVVLAKRCGGAGVTRPLLPRPVGAGGGQVLACCVALEARGCGIDGREHRAEELLAAWERLEQAAPALRVRHQVVGQRRGAAEQREQPGAELAVGRQVGLHVLPGWGVVKRAEETVERVERQVWIAGVGKRCEHLRIRDAECG